MTDADREQRLLDLAETLQQTVDAMSQLVAEVGDGREAMLQALEAVGKRLADAMPQTAKLDVQPVVRAIIDGLKGLTISPQINVQAPVVEFKPTITVPPAPPPVINIEGSREWVIDHIIDEHGRYKQSRLKRIS